MQPPSDAKADTHRTASHHRRLALKVDQVMECGMLTRHLDAHASNLP
jgi:hypothetical protein